MMKHKVLQLSFTFSALFVLSVLSAPSALAGTAAVKTPITVQSACTSDEKWMPEDPKTAYIQNRLELSRKGGKEAIQSMFRSLVARDALKPKDLHGKMIVSYWLARALYDAKEVHKAHQAFLDLLKEPEALDKFSDALAVHAASMECLTKIHHDYPTLNMDEGSLAAVKRLAPQPRLSSAQRAFFYEGLSWELKKRFRAGEAPFTDAEAQSYNEAFKGSGYFQKLVSVLRATQTPNEADIISNEAIFNEADYKTRPQNERDLLHSLFGRAYYDQAQWDKAVAHFKEIPHDSNQVVHAFSDSSWAYLQQQRYPETIGMSTNLVLGALSKTYDPAAYETLTMALFETCNYNEALQTYQHFRKIYGKSYFFLRDMQKAGTGFYPKLAAYLLGKAKGKVPDRVGTEWSSDPIFLADQSEINLGLDEGAATAKIRTSANQWINFARSKSWKSFDAELEKVSQENTARQPGLIAEIDRAIFRHTEAMFAALNQTAQSLQLLEAEAYEQIGDKYLAENGPAQNGKSRQPRTLKPKQGDGAVWDWGRYPAGGDGDEDTVETWEDELGYLRAKIKDSCK
jgi:TolA-binding protein